MNIEKINYGAWSEAYRCTAGNAELIVVTQIGPRILSLRVGNGPNILFEDDGGITRGDWRLYGGHRFWISPESEECYLPDNDPCSIEMCGDCANGCLKISQKPMLSGLQRILEIGSFNDTGFTIRHHIKNTGVMLASGAAWALTCVIPEGKVVAPWYAGSKNWSTNRVQFWSAWAGHGSNLASKQWGLFNDHFVIDPTGEEGKAGLYSEAGLIALLRPDCTFVKTYDPIPEAIYPDGGCNIELYTCGSFVEMETLGPVYTLYPGQSYFHTENWVITDKVYQPESWQKLRTLII